MEAPAAPPDSAGANARVHTGLDLQAGWIKVADDDFAIDGHCRAPTLFKATSAREPERPLRRVEIGCGGRR